MDHIPDGTLLIMYGDHTTSMDSSEFVSDVVDGKEYVACLILKKGTNLANPQQSRQQPIATDGSLNLLDVLSYFRHSVVVANPPATAQAVAHRAEK